MSEKVRPILGNVAWESYNVKRKPTGKPMLDPMQVLGDFESFAYERLLGPTSDLPVDVQEFTLQTWVEASEKFHGGANILRKRIRSTGLGTELSCWSWHLGPNREQQFHYGAHTYYNTSADIYKKIHAFHEKSTGAIKVCTYLHEHWICVECWEAAESGITHVSEKYLYQYLCKPWNASSCCT